jgi:dipeptidase E
MARLGSPNWRLEIPSDVGRLTDVKLLLTSSGISNVSIRNALVDLLGRPISEASAFVVPTAIYPFSVGPQMAGRLIRGEVRTPLTDLGWASVGVLELSALPSIKQEVWVPTVRAADALLFWGGDPLYLSYWMRASGLADLLPSLDDTVYVGTSAGAMVTASVFGETYTEPRAGSGSPLTSDDIVFSTPQGDVSRTFVTAEGVGLVDFAVIPHLDNEDHPDASLANSERWAAQLPVPTYAIDDETALVVTDGGVEVVSQGHWKLFAPH